MKLKVPKEITLPKFASWVKGNTQCEIRVAGRRINIVVMADNIESGRCVPLYAETCAGEVLVTELAADFYSAEEAWHALESGIFETYPAVPFHQWVQDQYLTASYMKIEKLSIG